MAHPKKLLFIQTAFLGDVVFSTALLSELRSMFPRTAITVLASPRGGGVLEGQSFVDRVLLYDKTGGERGIRSLLKLAAQLRRERFDLVVSPHRSFRSALLARFSGAPQRVGFLSGVPGLVYNAGVPWPEKELVPYRRELRLLTCLGGGGGQERSPRMVVGASAKRKAAERIAAAGGAIGTRPVAGLAVGTVWPTKKWPLEHFAATAAGLVGRGVDVVLLGGAGDEDAARAVAGRKGVINLVGRTTLAELPPIIANCDAFVAVDTGPLHLAMALQVPSVALFGPTDERQFEFSGRDRCLTAHVPCRPCSAHGSRECPEQNWICMPGVSPGDVLDALAGMGVFPSVRGEERP